ncbi:hypothetical protein MKX01_020586 [Papaver californicum]|nr:hypothetical protein MKX01_020586 [Papaver californicum]
MEGNTAGTATISIESFSYRWLVNLKSTLESLDDDHLVSSEDIEAAAFIVMDPKNTPSKRFLVDNFNFPTTPSSNHYINSNNNFSLVQAEELFSNGTFLIPSGSTLFSTKISEESIDNGIESSPMNSKQLKNNIVISIHQIHSIFAKKCWESSKKMFRKCLIGLFSNNNHNNKTTIYSSSSSSPSSSPPKSLGTSRSLLVDRRRRNSQKFNRSMSSPSSLTTNTTTTTIAPEGSIYEAVLHCKKSIEK